MPVDKAAERVSGRDKGTTLRELAEEGEVIMSDLPGDGVPAEKGRKGLPSEGATANAAANALHCGGMDGFG